MDFKHIFAFKKVMSASLVLIINLTLSTAFATVSSTELDSLDKEFQVVSNKLYRSLKTTSSLCQTRAKSLKQLNTLLTNVSNQNKEIISQCLIHNNLPLIKSNIDSKDIFSIFQFLLDNNNTYLANILYKTAQNESDQSFVSNLSYKYAQFHFKSNNWKKVLHYIQGTYNDLTKRDGELALLYTGIALQKIKQHRKAIKVYSKIPKDSEFYPAAKLNIATAYIRQDWWTDAHINIKDILENKALKTDNEMINRLYLVLGYSLLNKEFHRDSREAFRNIEINSHYFNKALLGIALTAANQEDYVGALNVINVLKEKKLIDLSVEESHLLQPYIYEKLNQNMTASASYSSAEFYYKKRIDELTVIKNSGVSFEHILNNKNQLQINNNVINISNHFGSVFLQNKLNIKNIDQHKNQFKNKSVLNKLQTLKSRYNTIFNQKISRLFEQRIAYINRYMNQSRYGLARLFDHSNKNN